MLTFRGDKGEEREEGTKHQLSAAGKKDKKKISDYFWSQRGTPKNGRGTSLGNLERRPMAGYYKKRHR